MLIKNKSKIIASMTVIIIISISAAFGKTFDDFKNDFEKALDIDFTEEQLNLMFKEYSQLLTPHSDVSTFFNELKGETVKEFPLEIFKSENLYKQNIEKLVNSSNKNHRILSYLIIAASNEHKYNEILLKRMKTEEDRGSRIWAGMALLYVKDNHTSELFDFLVEEEDIGDAHMLPLFIKLDEKSLRDTAQIKIKDENHKAKIIAAAVLGVTGINDTSIELLRKAVQEWPIDIKGYAIVPLMQLEAGDLLPTLEPFIKNEETRKISLQALANSPTIADQDYIIQLSKGSGKIEEEILDSMYRSRRVRMIRQWLRLIQTKRIPKDYTFAASTQPFFDPKYLPEDLKDEIINALYKIDNPEILAELVEALSGQKDEKSTKTIVHFLKHRDRSVRTGAAFAAQGNKSKILKDILPELIKNKKYRSGALTTLLIENNINNLQDIYEDIYKNDKGMKEDCIDYISAFPLPRNKEMLRNFLSDTNEDWSKRSDAALGLARLNDLESVDLIIEVMKEVNMGYYIQKDWGRTRYNIVPYLKILGMLKCEKSIGILKKLLTHEDEYTRETAESILKNWGM